MALLLNWPPSRGPNPFESKVTYFPGRVETEDVPMDELRKIVRDVPEVASWRFNLQVTDVATLSLWQASRILSGIRERPSLDYFDDWYDLDAPSELRTVIDYPLEIATLLTIEPMTVVSVGGPKQKKVSMTQWRVGYFLWVVSKEYERIYTEHERYRIWGHAMSDLAFERLTLMEDGMVHLGIGS